MDMSGDMHSAGMCQESRAPPHKAPQSTMEHTLLRQHLAEKHPTETLKQHLAETQRQSHTNRRRLIKQM